MMGYRQCSTRTSSKVCRPDPESDLHHIAFHSFVALKAFDRSLSKHPPPHTHTYTLHATHDTPIFSPPVRDAERKVQQTEEKLGVLKTKLESLLRCETVDKAAHDQRLTEFQEVQKVWR